MGSSNPPCDIPQLLALGRVGQLDLEAQISACRPLDGINQGFADLEAGVGIRTVINL